MRHRGPCRIRSTLDQAVGQATTDDVGHLPAHPSSIGWPPGLVDPPLATGGARRRLSQLVVLALAAGERVDGRVRDDRSELLTTIEVRGQASKQRVRILEEGAASFRRKELAAPSPDEPETTKALANLENPDVGLALRWPDDLRVPPGRPPLHALAHDRSRERVGLSQGDTFEAHLEQPTRWLRRPIDRHLVHDAAR